MAGDKFDLDDLSFEEVTFKKEHLIIIISGISLFAFII